MDIKLSSNLRCKFSELESDIRYIAEGAKEIDPDIDDAELFIRGRCCQSPFTGTAYPFEFSGYGSTRIFHRNGKITFQLASDTKLVDIVRLIGHELRHIGQFHRGKREHGFLTISPLREHTSELDAFSFEDVLLDHLGLC